MPDQSDEFCVNVADRERHASDPARELALDCVVAGIEAAHPERVVADALALDDGVLTVTAVDGTTATYDLDGYDRVLVVGAGNAAGHFAAAVERLLGDRVDGGAVVTDDPVETERIAVLPGDHPTPSEAGVESARRVRAVAADAGESDLVIGLLTGGGSALLAAPAEGVALGDLRETTEALLASGATISEINAVRKHCSAVKGGRLARAAAPADALGLAISDVTGDDPAVIASGPLSPDPTTYAEALAVLDRYGIDAPSAVTDRLERGAAGEVAETPGPGEPAFDGSGVEVRVVANARTALDAAREVAAAAGSEPLVLSSRVRGEAREAAKTHAAVAGECRAAGDPVEPPAVLLSAGEVTVTLGDDPGTGGPNGEFALSAALELDASGPDGEGIAVASVDTDGIDGATDAAGALVDDRLVGDERAIDREAAENALDAHDAYSALDGAGALLRTGATGTNVNDLRAIVVAERDAPSGGGSARPDGRGGGSEGTK